VVRLFLLVWLAAFAAQATDVLALVAPDACSEEVQGSDRDPCQDGCARCLCCARVAVFLTRAAAPSRVEHVAPAASLPPLDPSTTAAPRGIFHVPKGSPTRHA